MKSISIKSFCRVFVLFVWIGFQACSNSTEPHPIQYGTDQCVYCKMTISDPRFGSQFVTKKGRAYNFDDAQCMLACVQEGDINREDIQAFYLPDYISNELTAAEKIFYLKSDALKSPMRGDIAAFIDEKDRTATMDVLGGRSLTWEELWK